MLAIAAAVPVLTIATIAGAGGHHLPAVFENTVVRIWPEAWGEVPIASADLVDAEIAIRPADWRDPEIARRRFRIDWCADAGIPEHACQTPEHEDQTAARQRWCDGLQIDDCAGRFGEIEDAFESEWLAEREAYVDIIRGPDLRDRDLRSAAASGAFLVGVDLRRTQLERANLLGAWLERTNLQGARLDGADLRNALLEDANLWSASLQGADLEKARLQRAKLGFAQLGGADFRNASFESASFAGTKLGPSIAHGADFAGAEFLTQEQLAHVIGNDATTLPRDFWISRRAQLHVWSCWKDADVAETFARLWSESGRRPNSMHWIKEVNWLCYDGDEPRPVGRPAETVPPTAQ